MLDSEIAPQGVQVYLQISNMHFDMVMVASLFIQLPRQLLNISM